MRVISCIPEQLADVDAKLNWLDTKCEEYQPNIFVTPQEFFGGAVIMYDRKSLTRQEILPQLQKIAVARKTALIVGLVEHENDTNYEVIWFINKTGEYLGRVIKFALPKYDHVCTDGFGQIVPETNFDARFQVFDVDGLRVGAVFCWEAYSNILWSGLALNKPDIVLNMIKFGVNAWPVVRKRTVAAGVENAVESFGYGSWAEAGGWIERLRVAAKWQVKCPIICATNSWNLKPISMPLCGSICELDGQLAGEETFWHPTKEMQLKQIPEKIVVDEIDPARIRCALESKFTYKDMVGEFPPYSLARFTMMLKINRIETRLRTGREANVVEKKHKPKGLLY